MRDMTLVTIIPVTLSNPVAKDISGAIVLSSPPRGAGPRVAGG
jgi:hypothetical protein